MKKRIQRQEIFLIISFSLCAVFGILFFVMLIAANGKRDFENIQVESLDVISHGNVVLSLGSTESGSGYLSTYTPDGDRLIDLTRTENGGAMTSYSMTGKESVECSATKNGGFVGVYGSDGTPLMEMSRTEFGGDFRLFNRFDRVSVSMSTVKNGGVIKARNIYKGELVDLTHFTEEEESDKLDP